jgi:hypothetical protein
MGGSIGKFSGVGQGVSSGWPRPREGRSSFLKKRSKRLFDFGVGGGERVLLKE